MLSIATLLTQFSRYQQCICYWPHCAAHGVTIHNQQRRWDKKYGRSVPVCCWYGRCHFIFYIYATHTPPAAQLLAIRGLDHVINAIALIFVLSAANTDLYISSRTLYGLALEGKAPIIFKRVNRFGVPYAALGASIVMACFAFLNIGKGPGKVLEYLSNLASTFGALAWSEFCRLSTKHRNWILKFAFQSLYHIYTHSFYGSAEGEWHRSEEIFALGITISAMGRLGG